MINQEEFDKKINGITKRAIYPIQKFMFVNDVISASTAYTIGAITKDVIVGLLDNTILPIIKFIGNTNHISNIKNYINVDNNIQWISLILTHTGNIIWFFFLWLATTILSYVFLEHVFNRAILKLQTTIPDDEVPKFLKANEIDKKGKDDLINYHTYMKLQGTP
jgi:large-conductance mechanosensitive channel